MELSLARAKVKAMITDQETNFVYFSDLLPHRHSKFFKELTVILQRKRIRYGLLPDTNDIWCRDYMPVQVSKDEFVQFKYDPKYLQTKKWRLTITNAAKTCQAIGINPKISDLVVDGGNVVRCGSKAIMTECVYQENSSYPKESLVSLLKDLLKVDQLIMIPVEPEDPYGHADGCVRFISKDQVIINKPSGSHSGFDKELRRILTDSGLAYVELPYSIEDDLRNEDSAVGNYVNYLDTGSVILLPSYGGHEKSNEQAFAIASEAMEEHDKKVILVESTDLAKDGGILNCASWEIKLEF